MMGMTYTPETEVLDGVDVQVLTKRGRIVTSPTLIGADLVVLGCRRQIVGILYGPVRKV